LFNHESERRGEKFVTRKITKWIGEFVRWKDNQTVFEQGQLRMEDDSDFIYISPWDRKGFPKLRLGNLDARRDWGHAEDYVRAMWLMMRGDFPDDYVIATGQTRSIRDFLDTAFNLVDISDWTQYVVIDPEFYRPAEVDYLLGVPLKAKTVLGWETQVTFDELVQRMVESDINEAKLQRPNLQEI
jgi:GDPmannose 4,6-dehydratase